MKQIISTNYKELTDTYIRKDSVKAIILYVVCFIVYNMSNRWLTVHTFELCNSESLFISRYGTYMVGLVMNIVLIMIVVLFLLKAKESFNSVGINQNRFALSIVLGLIGGAVLVGLQVIRVCDLSQGLDGTTLYSTIGFRSFKWYQYLNYFMGALAAEMIFRGYIGTRMRGLLKSPIGSSIVTAILYVFFVGVCRYSFGFRLDQFGWWLVESWFTVISLIVLHFLCDFTYKKTNCLWGAVLLHVLYEIGYLMVWSRIGFGIDL